MTGFALRQTCGYGHRGAAYAKIRSKDRVQSDGSSAWMKLEKRDDSAGSACPRDDNGIPIAVAFLPFWAGAVGAEEVKKLSIADPSSITMQMAKLSRDVGPDDSDLRKGLKRAKSIAIHRNTRQLHKTRPACTVLNLRVEGLILCRCLWRKGVWIGVAPKCGPFRLDLFPIGSPWGASVRVVRRAIERINRKRSDKGNPDETVGVQIHCVTVLIAEQLIPVLARRWRSQLFAALAS
jgi:hypothetical protein